ncbi:hypothetical protein PBRA_002781 [Plasmodiophora brassicae]|nr:hypothetical protein PBRA_002781 [Plasmodiophora brassicae]
MPSNTIVSHEARALVYVPVVARTLLAIGDKIGSGTYGSVRRGTRSLCIHSIHGVCLQQNDPVDVAIKRQPKDDSGTSRLVHEVEVLKTLMSRLPHPNVIEILDEFFVNDVHWTVMQYIDGRSLYDHVNQLCAGMPESDARAIWARVLDGLGFLHSQNIYHSDLNPKNIVLDANGCPKIIDFSLSKVSRSGLVVSRCTEPFEAPEAGWDVQPYRGDKADIWSAGAILFWMIFFQHAQPFPAGLTYDIWKTVCRNYPVRFPASPDTTKQVRNLLSSVLDIDPDARPGTAEIGRQTWMTMPL